MQKQSLWKFLPPVAITLSLIFALATYAAFAQDASPPPLPASQLSQPAPAPQVVYVPQQLMAPTRNADGDWDVTPTVDSASGFLTVVLKTVLVGLLAIGARYLYQVTGIRVDTAEAARDIEIDKYAKLAGAECVRYALQQFGLKYEDLKDVELRGPVLSMAATYLFQLDKKVWTWVSAKEKHVQQWIEAQLPPEAALERKTEPGVGPIAAKVAP